MAPAARDDPVPAGTPAPGRAALGRTAALGLTFTLVFTAYCTIQIYAGKLFKGTAGADQLTTLYAAFTAACFVAPSVTNKLGYRVTMLLGILGYAALVASGLATFTAKGKAAGPLAALGLGCAALNGVGAALLWTAQGKLIMEYTDDSNRGFLFGVFWSIFQTSAVVGGLVAYFCFSSDAGNASL